MNVITYVNHKGLSLCKLKLFTDLDKEFDLVLLLTWVGNLNLFDNKMLSGLSNTLTLVAAFVENLLVLRQLFESPDVEIVKPKAF